MLITCKKSFHHFPFIWWIVRPMPPLKLIKSSMNLCPHLCFNHTIEMYEVTCVTMAMSHIPPEPLLWIRGIFTRCQHFRQAWLLENNGHFGNCQFSSRVNCYRVGALWFAEAVISWAPIPIRATLFTSLQSWADNSTVLGLTKSTPLHLQWFARPALIAALLQVRT